MSQSVRSVDDQSAGGTQGESASAKACDACFRSKVKCVGRTDPPCERCRATRQVCTSDGRRKSKIVLAESRIGTVESQMEGFQHRIDSLEQTVAEILELCKSSASSIPESRIGQPGMTGDSEFAATVLVGGNRTTGRLLSSPTIIRPTSLRDTFSANDVSEAYHNISTSSSHQSATRASCISLPFPNSVAFTADDNADSAEGSMDPDDDPLVDIAKMAPLNRMVVQVEALRPDNSLALGQVHGDEIRDHPSENTILRDDHNRKRRRLSRTIGAADGASHHSDTRPRTLLATSRWDDPVAENICTEAEGRMLFDVFFSSCHITLPVFDPTYDTWDSMRDRSTFALSAILMVASMTHFAGQSENEIQIRSQLHTESIARRTLLSPDRVQSPGLDGSCSSAALAEIQALILLAAWGDSGWRTGGHAFRLAIEAELHRCLPSLSRTEPISAANYMLADKQRRLVIGARLWLAICKMEYEYAFNHGRPLLIGSDPSIGLGRQFLDHPLSTAEDSRLVAACELLQGRQRNHLIFGEMSYSTPSQTIEEVRLDNECISEWYISWLAFYDARSVVAGHYLREALKEGKFHAQLVVNSRLLSNLGGTNNASRLAVHQHNALRYAIEAASGLVHMSVSSTGFIPHFKAANSLAHVGMVFAARLLVRFATLLPHSLDLRQIGHELEALSATLETVPKLQLAERLRSVLGKARRRLVFPPLTRAQSPAHRNGETEQEPFQSVDALIADWIQSPNLWPVDFTPDHDFQSVDALFNWGASAEAPVLAPPELAESSVAFLDLFADQSFRFG